MKFACTPSKAKHLGLAAVIAVLSGLTQPITGHAATLPIACVASACGAGVTWNDASTAPSAVGNTLTINQSANRAIYNWSSFNISADGKVIFNQPNANAVALNKIYDANPTQIFGSLQANGQLYLLNQNGFLFGSGSRVNTGGLLASSLNITDDIFNNGLLSSTQKILPALQSAGNLANIVVEPGAKIVTNADGQRVLLAAKTISNQGEITANGGQVVLAAGDKIYVSASDDPALRGLLVEVSGGGTVTNTGTVTAERGNITAVGLAVNQNGRMTATTSVSENGSIRLLARDGAQSKLNDLGQNSWVAHTGGALTLGSNSVTQVNADAADKTTAVDDQKQLPSTLEFVGKTVEFAESSQVLAAGGQLKVVAASDPGVSRDEGILDEQARIHVNSGAVIDLSGNTETTSVTRNLVSVELRGNELADSPQQRDGVLRGKTVIVDARVGTPLANVDGAINLIGHSVLERTSQGGTVTLDSAGDVVVANNATIDVSGGAVNYEGGVMGTTQLIKADGSTVDIAKATADTNYLGLVNPLYKAVSDRWGVITNFISPGFGNYEPGYVQGADAGSIQIMGNALSLDGNFIGSTTNGRLQRSPISMAKGGQFIIGIDGDLSKAFSFRAPEILIQSHAPATAIDINTALDKDGPLNLSTDFLKQGFTRIQLASDKQITVSSSEPLVMSAGSTLTLRAPKIEINSDISSASGVIDVKTLTSLATAPDLTGLKIANGTVLNVSGAWINDALVPLDREPSDPLFIKGGSISLEQSAINGTLSIGDDVSLLANGGAWLKTAGSISGGSGGSIKVNSSNANTADLNQTFEVGSDLNIQGFGVEGATGGALNIRVPRLKIIDDYQWLIPQKINTSQESTALQLGSSLFSDYGFSSFTLQADSHVLDSDPDKATLVIAPDTQINLTSLTLGLTSNASRYASGTDLSNFSSLAEVPTYQLKPSKLTLLATTALGDRKQYGGILVENNSLITAPTDSTITMRSMGDLTFGGQIDVPSGIVNLSVIKSAVDNEQQFEDRQLTLQSTSVINVSGGTILKPNDAGLRQGVLTDGGDVVIKADIGSVNFENNAVIDISGTQSVVDLQNQDGSGYAKQTVTTTGGSLTLTGAESITLLGDLFAKGGSNGSVSNTGGSLTVELTRQLPGSGAETFNKNPRVVQLTNSADQSVQQGIANINAQLVKNSGVANMTLAADDQIAFGNGVDLSINQRVLLDAPEIRAIGDGNAKLSAAYLAVGPKESVSSRPVAKEGDGQLLLIGEQQIDVTGSVAFQNKQTTLSSNGSINLEGYGASINASGGVINTTGDLILEAAQVLPTTGSSFAINATGANSTVQIKQTGLVPPLPMSVAGSLTINAANIIQGGTLAAPFGSLSLNASKSLKMLDGSVTTVSGNGSLLPYGRVDNGNDWVWGVDPNDPQSIFGTPARRIQLSGNVADLNSGAIIDVSGGGDLLAYQFTPGTGGRTDALSGQVKELWAIIPSIKDKSVPYDPMMWNGSNVTPGDSIYLAEGSGVPAGVYQLLPARYALLPGAYLVSSASGFQDIQPGFTASTTDGAKVVAGYVGFGNSENKAARYTGYSIRPGSYAHQLAQYDDYLASSFFSEKVDAGSASSTGLPRDSGVLSIGVQQSLSALATVRGQASSGGVNASVEIQAPTIEVVNEQDSNEPNGSDVTLLSSNTINGWHVGRLLLGGKRNEKGAIDVGTEVVTIQQGAKLVADEVVLTASQGIDIKAGAILASTSSQNPELSIDETRFATPRALELTGEYADQAAVLAVSDLNYLVTERQQYASNGASINVESGGAVATRGSVSVDAVGEMSLANNSIKADHASWDIGARQLSFGAESGSPDGLLVDESVINQLQAAKNITLKSISDIDINKAVTLGATSQIDTLNIQANRINNLAGSESSSLQADRIKLNGVDQTESSLVSGEGHIAFNAKEIELGSGQIGFSGFGDTVLNSTGVIVGKDEGGIAVGGNLSITSTAITTDSGAHTRIDAKSGEVSMVSVGDAPNPQALVAGGILDISGQRIIDSSKILMPSGVVTLSATDNLELTQNSIINTAGVNPVLASTGSNGGFIQLISDGKITTESNSELNVSAGKLANSGAIDIRAAGSATIKGVINGSADGVGIGGGFSLQAQSVDDFSSILQSVQNGEFSNYQNYRVSQGDLVVGQGQELSANKIEITADNGSIDVKGTLVAKTGSQPSEISLNASKDVVVEGSAILDANANDISTQKSGDIVLSTSNGQIKIAADSVIKATDYQGGGSLILRAPVAGNDFNLDQLPANMSQIDSVVLEPVQSFNLTEESPSGNDFDEIRNQLSSYVSTAKPNIVERLGIHDAGKVVLRPYANITRIGDLILPTVNYSDLSAPWVFDGQPADVSIRATGNLEINGVQSDGFIETNNGVDVLNRSTSSLNFVAGADLASANNKSTIINSGKDIILKENSKIRTGTGNISLTASHDVVLDKQASVYTSGIKGADTKFNSDGASVYAEKGGTVTIRAGNNVLASVVNQAVNEWQTHGDYVTTDGTTGIYWGNDYGSFGWNVGALGGGNVIVHAGGDIKDLSAAVSDSVVFDQVANKRLALGGGNLLINAGKDIQSGYFYVGHGQGYLNALEKFGVTGNRQVDGESLGTFLVSGDASFHLSATGDILFEGLLHNPALLYTRPAEQETPFFFNRYGSSSLLSLNSSGGNIEVKQNDYYRYKEFGNYQNNDESAKTLYPASLDFKAFSGDLIIKNSPVLSPSPTSNIELYADGNIEMDGELTMSDVLTNNWTAENASSVSDFVERLRDSSDEIIHAQDARLVKIAAGNDVVGLRLKLPKAAEVRAGRDVVDLFLQGQQSGLTSDTVISAGRDVVMSDESDTREIAVGGEGTLQVIAGRNVDLRFSKGVFTTGNLRNGNLPADHGAKVFVVAGLAHPLGINKVANSTDKDFISEVVAANITLRQKLVDYMAAKTGNNSIDYDAASAAFRSLDLQQQLPLAVDLLFSELVASGRETNKEPALEFKRGYKAMESLFPGSQLTQSPYSGNVILPFSRVYSLNGGDIAVLAPGGKIDVGLANTPASLANIIGDRPASELGIVAQQSGDVRMLADQDVLVNTSRVFTLGGGNIAIWSSKGNIDAGKGAKSAISAPPPTLVVDANGNVSINFASAVAGSGIRTISTGSNVKPGDVDLIAPAGFVNAGDAGIGSSGNLNIAAQSVVGLDNIQVGGTSTGVPPETGGLGASLSGVTSSASSSTAAASNSVADNTSAEKNQTAMTDAALSWLEVFVIGLGEDTCKQDDLECLKRQTLN